MCYNDDDDHDDDDNDDGDNDDDDDSEDDDGDGDDDDDDDHDDGDDDDDDDDDDGEGDLLLPNLINSSFFAFRTQWADAADASSNGCTYLRGLIQPFPPQSDSWPGGLVQSMQSSFLSCLPG